MKQLFCLMLFFSAISSFSQTTEGEKTDETIYDLITLDEQAVFPGDMRKFIKSNLKWPKDGSCIKGKVYVSFDVDTNGIISNPVIKRGVSESANQEAIKLIMKMPKWIPAKRDGKPIKCRMVLPINFDIE